MKGVASHFNARVMGKMLVVQHAIKNHAFDNACLMVPPIDMLEFQGLDARDIQQITDLVETLP